MMALVRSGMAVQVAVAIATLACPLVTTSFVISPSCWFCSTIVSSTAPILSSSQGVARTTTGSVMTKTLWMIVDEDHDEKNNNNRPKDEKVNVDDDDTMDDALVVSSAAAPYGVSYIGGDPCGSKYNNDPFDVQVQKPGMPEDMKARIQALVDKKVAEEQAQLQKRIEE